MFLGPYVIILLCSLASFLPWIRGHGRLIEPPSRASAWRYGFDTPHNYNDHELFCGGFTRQWVKNDGKCGVCGDPWDSKLPRAHEYGGTYGQGVIVRKYTMSSTINIRVELTASHYGFFEFSLCPDYKTPTQECLDRRLLKLAKPQEGVEHKGVRYFPKEGSKVYEMKYRLPNKSCEHCLLQWRYRAGNNWGNCPNGTGAVGCGPQEEFRACADISIGAKGDEADQPMLPDVPAETTPTITTTTTLIPEVVPTPEESYNPIAALILSIVSFLVVFLILSLLYIHFYQVGKQVKSWLKGGNNSNSNFSKSSGSIGDRAPLPPPRIKRQNREIHQSRDGMHDVDLGGDESLATPLLLNTLSLF